MTVRRILLLVTCGAWGCGGGQTGDTGTRGELCGDVSTSEWTWAEAEAHGFDRTPVDASISPNGERSWEILLTGAPSLWTDEGLSPPADRSTNARLTLRTLDQVTYAQHEGAPEGICEDRWLVPLAATLELADLGAVLEAGGELQITEGADNAAITLDLFSGCGWGGAGASSAGSPELLCNDGTYGGSKCLDATSFVELPTDPLTGSDIGELMQQAFSLFPLTLACDGGASADLTATLDIPMEYCAYTLPRSVPVILGFESPELGLAGLYAGGLSVDTDARCGSCETLTEDECDALPRCTEISASSAQRFDESLPRITLRIDDEGAMVVHVRTSAQSETACTAEQTLE